MSYPPVGVNLRGCTLGKRYQGVILEDLDLRAAIMDETDLKDAVLRGADLRGALMNTAKNLTAEQVLSARDWRGADLPDELNNLEVRGDAEEKELDRLGRTWKEGMKSGR